MFKFTQHNLGWARTSLIEVEFRTKEELFKHWYLKNYASRTIFTRFSLKKTDQGVMLLGEYYGGTEYHVLGRIEGPVTKLDIPYREQNW